MRISFFLVSAETMVAMMAATIATKLMVCQDFVQKIIWKLIIIAGKMICQLYEIMQLSFAIFQLNIAVLQIVHASFRAATLPFFNF